MYFEKRKAKIGQMGPDCWKNEIAPNYKTLKKQGRLGIVEFL